MAIYMKLKSKNASNEKFTDPVSVELWIELFSRNLLNRFSPVTESDVAGLKKIITNFVGNFQRFSNQNTLN